MPPKFTRSLADDLDRQCAMHVIEAADGQRLQAGHGVHRSRRFSKPNRTVTRADWSVASPTIRRKNAASRRSTTCSVRWPSKWAHACWPSIMTGMGDDGHAGCKLLKQRGAYVIAQDAASCVVYGMPRQVVDQGLADMIRPLDAIGRGDCSSGLPEGRHMLTSHDIDAVCDLVIDLCGVYLDESKAYLIEARLGELVKRSGLRELRRVCPPRPRRCRPFGPHQDRQCHHHQRNAVLPRRLAVRRAREQGHSRNDRPQGGHAVRQTASASGPPPAAPARSRTASPCCSPTCCPTSTSGTCNILGTDISDDAVARASRGWYTAHEIERGMPPARLHRYFQRRTAAGG